MYLCSEFISKVSNVKNKIFFGLSDFPVCVTESIVNSETYPSNTTMIENPTPHRIFYLIEDITQAVQILSRKAFSKTILLGAV